MEYYPVMEYCSIIKKNKLLTCAASQMNLKGITLSEKKPISKDHIFCDSAYIQFSR